MQSRAPLPRDMTEDQLREAWYKGDDMCKWHIEEEVLRIWHDDTVERILEAAWQRGAEGTSCHAQFACAACYRPRQFRSGEALWNCCRRCFMSSGEQHDIECEREWRMMNGEQGRMELAVRQRHRRNATPKPPPPPPPPPPPTSHRCDSCGIPGQGYEVVWCCPQSIDTFDRGPLREHDSGCVGYYLCQVCLDEARNDAEGSSSSNDAGAAANQERDNQEP